MPFSLAQNNHGRLVGGRGLTDAAGIAEAAEYMTMQMLDMAAAVTAACLQGDTEWAKDRMGWLLSDANWVMTLQDSDECKPIPRTPLHVGIGLARVGNLDGHHLPHAPQHQQHLHAPAGIMQLQASVWTV